MSEDVGGLGEEAVKLLGAFSDWAAKNGHEYAGASGLVVDGLASALRDVDAHVATGAAECRYCPLCRVIAAVRGTSPEVRGHLASAADSLLSAAAGVLATRVPREDPAPTDHEARTTDLGEDDEGRDH